MGIKEKTETREYPLREKRRSNTRAALIKAANELMWARGFNKVTMQEVADHAGTHAQTLYAHFPNKYALGSAASVESLRIAIASRKTDTMTFWRSWTQRAGGETQNDETGGDAFKRYARELDADPQLVQVTMASAFEHLQILTENLAADFSLDPKMDLFPRLVAHMLYSATEHAVIAWRESDGDFDLLAAAHKAIDEVISIVNLVRAAQGVSSTGSDTNR